MEGRENYGFLAIRNLGNFRKFLRVFLVWEIFLRGFLFLGEFFGCLL
jgi:hypothetical protein